MLTALKLPLAVHHLLRCPICGAEVAAVEGALKCLNPACGAIFPIVDGIPILINEDVSIFSLADFVQRRDTYFDEGRVEEALKRLLPSLSKNVKGVRNYALLTKLLLRFSPTPRVLVLGGSIVGSGMKALLAHPLIELVETDVSFGPRTALICDAHDIPFADKTFDGVIAQAVLEHVVDPYRCVAEISRVLKDKGLVYAETPFMQQVHGGRYDFTRFTHLGHRRLFRDFEELESGAVGGPGMALAWAYQYFLLSFARGKVARALLGLFARLTAFHWKYFDPYLIDRPGALDAASGYYFIGRRSDRTLPDRELLRLYRGAI